MNRLATPPANVSGDDAGAAFRSGISEIRPKMTTRPQKSKIAIEQEDTPLCTDVLK
jgi:hypothetical protein